MATAKQAKKKRLNMAERAQQQLDLHFTNFPAALLWRRKVNDGYTTVPRTLPIAMQAIDVQTKGRPAGHTLFCLWARTPDNPLLVIENPTTFASEAGFSGERAVDTWRKRMKQLVALNFIQCRTGPSGDFHYVLLLNPNVAMETMHKSKNISAAVYARFIDRLSEVGAQQDIADAQDYWAEQAAGEPSAEKASTTASKGQKSKPAPRKSTVKTEI